MQFDLYTKILRYREKDGVKHFLYKLRKTYLILHTKILLNM